LLGRDTNGLKVRHEKSPEGAAAEAIKYLKQAVIDIEAREFDPETLKVSAVDPRRLKSLNQAPGKVSQEPGFPATRCRDAMIRVNRE
jgi:hypothetical protein